MNLNVTIRKLTIHDMDLIEYLLDTRRGKMKDDVYGFNREDFEYRFNSQSELYGAFRDGILLSTLGWRDLHFAPYSVTLGLMINGHLGKKFFNPLESGLVNLMHNHYRLAEQRGIIRHYSVRRAKFVEAEMRMWDRSSDEFERRYIRQDEAFVPKSTKPKHFLYQAVLGDSHYPYDVIIRSVSLSNSEINAKTGKITDYPVWENQE